MTVVSSLPVATDPYVLAISADDQYLYAGFSSYANVQRYTLPGLTPDLLIPLGVGDAFETVVGDNVRGIGTVTGHDFSKLTWGADATALYALGDDAFTLQPISRLTVSSSGVVFDQALTNDIYLGFRPHFDAPTGLIYGDGGAIIQPSTLALVDNFQASGVMVPDSTLGLAYFLGQTQSQVEGNSGQDNHNLTLQIFDLKTYALLDSIVVPNVIGYPIQMTRWGASGIAFTTENGGYQGNNAPGLTYILSGTRISRTTGSLQPTPADTERVQFTWGKQSRRR